MLTESSAISVSHFDVQSNGHLPVQPTHPDVNSDEAYPSAGDVLSALESGERGACSQANLERGLGGPSHFDVGPPSLVNGVTASAGGMTKSAFEATEHGGFAQAGTELALSQVIPNGVHVLSESESSSSSTLTETTETAASNMDLGSQLSSPEGTPPPTPASQSNSGEVSPVQCAKEDEKVGTEQRRISPETCCAWLSLAALVGPPISLTPAPPTSPTLAVPTSTSPVPSHSTFPKPAPPMPAPPTSPTCMPAPPTSPMPAPPTSPMQVPPTSPMLAPPTSPVPAPPTSPIPAPPTSPVLAPSSSLFPSLAQTTQYNASANSSIQVETAVSNVNLSHYSNLPQNTYPPVPVSHTGHCGTDEVLALQHAEEGAKVDRENAASHREWLSPTAALGPASPTSPMLALPSSPVQSPLPLPVLASPTSCEVTFAMPSLTHSAVQHIVPADCNSCHVTPTPTGTAASSWNMQLAPPSSVQTTHPAWLSHSNENIPPTDVILDLEGTSRTYECALTNQGLLHASRPPQQFSYSTGNDLPTPDVGVTRDVCEDVLAPHSNQGTTQATFPTWPSPSKPMPSDVMLDLERVSSMQDQGLHQATQPISYAYGNSSSADDVSLSLEYTKDVDVQACKSQSLPPEATPHSVCPTYSSPWPSHGASPPPCNDVVLGREGTNNVLEPAARTEQGLSSHAAYPPPPPPLAQYSGCYDNNPSQHHGELAIKLTKETNNNMRDCANQDLSTVFHPPASVSQSSPQVANDVGSVSARCLKSALKMAEESWSNVHVHAHTQPKCGISHPLHRSVKAPKVSRFNFTGCISVSTLSS